MNYIGSKHSLADFIQAAILRVTGPTEALVLAELFGGTGIVARRFKPRVRQVIVNDTEPYSFVLLKNYIGNGQSLDYAPWLAQLNELPGQPGFVFTQYCAGGGQGRQYFSDENGLRIDAIRQKISHWQAEGRIEENLRYFLLASLLESADKVANTASVYGAFLKQLKKSAQKPLVLVPALFEPHPGPNLVFQEEANALVEQIEGDILYLDPPYNARQYGANYHLLNTIALYEPFQPQGKTGLRPYYRSPYCQKDKALAALTDLLKKARFRYIFLSYNNEGLIPLPALSALMQSLGHYDRIEQVYTRFRADKAHLRQHKASATIEYLHMLEKRG
ncbi:MAG: DNA adenine methylase [Microscillaceae bacterium]